MLRGADPTINYLTRQTRSLSYPPGDSVSGYLFFHLTLRFSPQSFLGGVYRYTPTYWTSTCPTSRGPLHCSRTQFPFPVLPPQRLIPSRSDGMALVPWATSWHVTSPHRANRNQTLPPCCCITAPCRKHRNLSIRSAHRLPKSLQAQLNWLPSVMLYLPIWQMTLLCRACTTSSQRRCRYVSFLYTDKQVVSHSPLGNTTLQSKDFR
jgi:hypothetical protein